MRVEHKIALYSYCDRIVLSIFGHHEECGSSADLDPSSLSDRIREGSFMLSNDLSHGIDDIPRFFWEAFLEKFLHTHFPDKAESLTVFSLCIRESYFLGELSNF